MLIQTLEFAGVHAGLFFEDLAEEGIVGISNRLADFCKFHCAVGNQPACFLNADRLQILPKRQPCFRLKPFADIRQRITRILRQLMQGQFLRKPFLDGERDPLDHIATAVFRKWSPDFPHGADQDLYQLTAKRFLISHSTAVVFLLHALEQ